jgi:hypothetical protein
MTKKQENQTVYYIIINAMQVFYHEIVIWSSPFEKIKNQGHIKCVYTLLSSMDNTAPLLCTCIVELQMFGFLSILSFSSVMNIRSL